MSKTPVQPNQRSAALQKCRNLKMARSAHAYVRGSASKFYEWLTSVGPRQLPSGPPIWICGDCHSGNLGPLGSVDGRVQIGIRDLDQTVIGNPSHDLIRLALSLATAARGSDLSGVTTAYILEAMIEGYERGLLHTDEKIHQDAGPVKIALRQALKRKWRDLAEERIEDTSPTIPLGKCFWPLTKAEKHAIELFIHDEHTRKLVTALRKRNDDDEISLADAAYWVKGCSSLGRLRYAVLVRVTAKNSPAGFCLLDVKEACKAAAPRQTESRMPRGNADRVLKGACSLSPLLGKRMLAARLCDRPVFVRELLPQDLKLDIENVSLEEAISTAYFLAGVLGKAHGRQLSSEAKKAWISELKRNRSKSIDAPSWLWTSIVELIAIHEKAYLDHCRKYALQNARDTIVR